MSMVFTPLNFAYLNVRHEFKLSIKTPGIINRERISLPDEQQNS